MSVIYGDDDNPWSNNYQAKRTLFPIDPKNPIHPGSDLFRYQPVQTYFAWTCE